MELLLGCGRRREKHLWLPDRKEWNGLVTLDMNPDVGADVVHDLAKLPLPFHDDSADEIHAYEVLEHVGQQGDWRFFFDQWADFWRILKPGGHFFGSSPFWASKWAWGDPGHTRIVGAEQLIFLVQPQYELQAGKTPMTDYRFHYKADFDIVHASENNGAFYYALQAVKPSRCKV
jgi:SAM-dependent methyltransferase